MPPATSMKTPAKEGQMNRNRTGTETCEFRVHNSAAPTEHERMVWLSCSVVAPSFPQPAPTDDDGCKLHNINREPQPHEITGQDTVRHTSTEHHADTKTTIFFKGIGQKRATVPYHCSFCPITFKRFLYAIRTIPAMFSKVSVAGALLLESHSWYLTQVLSRSSMKPFSWELQGVWGGGERGNRVNRCRKWPSIWAAHSQLATQMKHRQPDRCTDKQWNTWQRQTDKQGRRGEIQRCDIRQCIGWL